MKLFFLVLFIMASFGARSQGCSDAGFCTLNSFKPAAEEPKKQLKAGMSWGRADYRIMIISNAIEYLHPIAKNSSLDVKVTSLGQSGNGVSVYYPSDVFLNYNYAHEKWKFTLGAKLPLNRGNRKVQGFSLPLDYQSSLGTADLIAGVSFEIKKSKWAVAIQQPITQNKNEFLPAHFVNTELQAFTPTYRFKRKGDMLIRASYPFSVKKLTVAPGALAIYHLGNDKYVDGNTEKEIKGSDGFTVNLAFFADYKLNEKSSLHFNVGSPVVYRQARPDGLTRKVIMTLEYSFTF